MARSQPAYCALPNMTQALLGTFRATLPLQEEQLFGNKSSRRQLQCPCSTGKHAPVHAKSASSEGKRAPCGTAPATPSLDRPAGQCCLPLSAQLGGRKPGCTCCQAHRKAVRTWVQSARVGGAARRARLHHVHHSLTSCPSAENNSKQGHKGLCVPQKSMRVVPHLFSCSSR